MKTFEELFCEALKCDAEKFEKKIFWRSLPLRTQLAFPFISAFSQRFFEADYRLIDACARARDMDDVRIEIRGYFCDSSFWGWFRRVAGIRISTHRLKALARAYLPDPRTGDSDGPFSSLGEPGMRASD